MKQQHPATTLTFFTLRDFVAEAKRRKLLTVHCEAIQQDKGMGSGAPSPMREYKLVLTALDVSTVLACTILTGRVWAIFAKDEPHHAENLTRAREIIGAHLTGLGLDVQPGMYHHADDGLAVAEGLWHFDEKKRLVPLVKEVLNLECRNPRCRWEGTTEEAPFYSELDEYGCPNCGGFDLRIAGEPESDCQDCPLAEGCKDLCLRGIEEVAE
jgi:hypothetical protein